MLDAFREEDIVHKVGGRFKLSTLIQKRMVALNRGARPLVDLPTKDHMEVVVAEILQDKIYLDFSGNVRAAQDTSAKVDSNIPEDGGPTLEDVVPL